ncbi:EpsG family protein [Limosilactobacillus vaginalis]|uniref:EpsG family protein n=1 Tax=Limosilactobacillus vaginalis TaxID=1633 RepID=UPI0025A4B650|nr:EpsG family protein [Limosilactobacillus vaginalis]MDM8260097.1 EpsG family protein [Limosilactobacillus vaginalis]
MVTYYFIYCSVPLIYYFSSLISKFLKPYNLKKIFLNVTLVILFVFSAFRALSVGTDTITYFNIFEWMNGLEMPVSEMAKEAHIEYGYIFINKVISSFGGNFRVVMILVSFITLLGIGRYILYFSSNYLTSLIIFIGFTYYFLSFNISRQFLAISIDLFSLSFLLKKEKWKSLTFILIAGLIHNSGFLFIVLWLLSQVNISKIKFIFLGIFSVIFSVPICKFIENYMGANVRYNVILNSTSSKGLFGIVYSLALLLVFILYVIDFNFSSNNIKDRLFLYSFLIITFINIMEIFFPFLGRIRYTFEVLIIAIIPNVIDEFRLKRYYPIINIIIFLLGVIIMYKLIPNNSFYGILPYKAF